MDPPLQFGMTNGRSVSRPVQPPGAGGRAEARGDRFTSGLLAGSL